MTPSDNGASRDDLPTAEVQTRKKGISLIWVVPLVALIVGGWLAVKALQEKGPVITITFKSAEGLEAGKTKLKYKDVEVGTVTGIDLSDDLSHIVVTAEMHPDAKAYLTNNTRFWVVRARVAAGEVTGLGTLFSGAYIGVDPSTEGKSTRQFEGLEKPPIITANLPGRHFMLKSDTLGSLDRGAPVYYRQIKVGQVVDYDFDATRDGVDIKVFVEAPYHEKVYRNTRFWNASGIDFQLGASGVKIDTQSLVSIMLGGIAFDLPEHLSSQETAEENHPFQLYPDQAATEEKTYTIKKYVMMYFDQNVRGLSIGAPVEMKGIRVGEVVDVQIEVDADELTVRIPVLTVIEPERFAIMVEDDQSPTGEKKSREFQELTPRETLDNMKRLVQKGMRAQLKTGNLLTGQLYVDLDFYPDAPPAQVVTTNGHPVFPTIPAPLERIVQRVDNTLKELEKIPFGQIGKDLQTAITGLNQGMLELKTLLEGLNTEITPQIDQTLVHLQRTLDDLQRSLGTDSALNYNTNKAMEELGSTLRSLRNLTDTLERDPQSLIFGKDREE